jgi:hypothetical protein
LQQAAKGLPDHTTTRVVCKSRQQDHAAQDPAVPLLSCQGFAPHNQLCCLHMQATGSCTMLAQVPLPRKAMSARQSCSTGSCSTRLPCYRPPAAALLGLQLRRKSQLPSDTHIISIQPLLLLQAATAHAVASAPLLQLRGGRTWQVAYFTEAADDTAAWLQVVKLATTNSNVTAAAVLISCWCAPCPVRWHPSARPAPAICQRQCWQLLLRSTVASAGADATILC